MFHRVSIVGLGLMGGAIGLAARQARVANQIIGVADRPETVEQAKRMGCVDDALLNLKDGVQDADLVILAVPIRMIADVARAVQPYLRHDSVLTDIGSSKAAIVASVEECFAQTKAKAHFVGSHPIAGSEKNGIESAPDVKFKDAFCIMTPTQVTDKDATPRLDEFWKALGMKTVRMSPAEHDTVLARSSHLPHVLSYLLSTMQTQRSFQYSGPGLKDMTRLSGSEVALWTDIFALNGKELSKLMRDFGKEMLNLADEVEMMAYDPAHRGQQSSPGAEAARERVFRFLADAKQRRDTRYTLAAEAAAAAAAAEAEEDGDAPGIREKDTQIL